MSGDFELFQSLLCHLSYVDIEPDWNFSINSYLQYFQFQNVHKGPSIGIHISYPLCLGLAIRRPFFFNRRSKKNLSTTRSSGVKSSTLIEPPQPQGIKAENQSRYLGDQGKKSDINVKYQMLLHHNLPGQNTSFAMSEAEHRKDSNKRYYTTDEEQDSNHEKPTNQVHQPCGNNCPGPYRARLFLECNLTLLQG